MLPKTALRLACLAALGFGVAASSAREDYSSKASEVFALRPTTHSPEARAQAAQAFLATLDDAQRERALLSLTDPERRLWTNLPAANDAGGLRLGDLDREQLAAASALLAELFSEQGYRKIVHVLLGDDVLWEQEGRRRGGLGVAETRVALFGEPSATEPWGFQIDGHHVGMNVALHGDDVTHSPSFIGAQPDVFVVAGEELRPMVREVELALQLVRSLGEEQRAAGVQGAERQRLTTGPGADGRVPEPVGVSVGTFNGQQLDQLGDLMLAWIGDLPGLHAGQLRELAAGGSLRFAWWGPTDGEGAFSYRIQGPTVLIEFACVGPPNDPQDHLHSMYRDPTNEYGGQLGD